MISDTAMILRAAVFASHAHRECRRKDANLTPYINHPLSLAACLADECDVTDAVVLCAALLHDTVEDCDVTLAELEALFGAEVASVVGEVTNSDALSPEEQKRAQITSGPGKSPRAKLVKLADKTCNLRDIDAIPPASWDLARKQKYFDWSAEVVAGMRGTNAALEAAFDAAYSLRPA